MTTSLYQVQGIAGSAGTPGAPLLHFSLLVNSSTGAITGQATITQAITPPGGQITIANVTGELRKTGFGQLTQVVALEGTYEQAGPPPTDYIVQRSFSAHFATDTQWNGYGGFKYGSTVVEKVPVKNTSASVGPIHTLYGVVIHDAQASGDLARMKAVAAEAERHIAATPGVTTALTALQAEIKKAGG